VGKPPPDPLGIDHSAGPWQRTGAIGKGDPAHQDDTLGEFSASTEMEDCKFLVAGLL